MIDCHQRFITEIKISIVLVLVLLTARSPLRVRACRAFDNFCRLLLLWTSFVSRSALSEVSSLHSPRASPAVADLAQRWRSSRSVVLEAHRRRGRDCRRDLCVKISPRNWPFLELVRLPVTPAGRRSLLSSSAGVRMYNTARFLELPQAQRHAASPGSSFEPLPELFAVHPGSSPS